MSMVVTKNGLSQLAQTVTKSELQSGCVPDEPLGSIMAAQIAEEFREFLLVIALGPDPLVNREALGIAKVFSFPIVQRSNQ